MLGWEQQKSRMIHRHQGWKGPIPDFASETVGSNSWQRLHKAGDGKAVMAGVGGWGASVGKAEAPSISCGQGKGGEEGFVWPCRGES